jgi:hypothetical protein
VNAILHPRVNNHCIGRFKPKIANKMQYFNLALNSIATNEYGKEITRAPFELQTFVGNAIHLLAMEHLLL